MCDIEKKKYWNKDDCEWKIETRDCEASSGLWVEICWATGVMRESNVEESGLTSE